MKSIKHCSGRLKKALRKRGWAQALFETFFGDGHRVLVKGKPWRLLWCDRSRPGVRENKVAKGEAVTLRTAAIRAGLLPRSFCR